MWQYIVSMNNYSMCLPLNLFLYIIITASIIAITNRIAIISPLIAPAIVMFGLLILVSVPGVMMSIV